MDRRLKIIGIVVALALLGAACFGPPVYQKLKRWVDSPAFCNLLSREVSKALKLEGRFSPITLHGLTANTDNYHGTGLPGEAIGSMDAEIIRGKFNFGAIFRRVWQIDRIDIDRGRFVLIEPNDALKRPPVKGEKPWYALLMPDQFYCRWIECPQANIDFTFLGQPGGLHQVHLGATMINRDFKYFVHGGTVQLAPFPLIGVNELIVLITREKLEIDWADLRGLNHDPARAELSAIVGMRHDKSVKATVKLEQMPFDQALPETLRNYLTGRLTGTAKWSTESTGKQTTVVGDFQLLDTHLKAWKWLEDLSRLHHNPDLLYYDFSKASGHFVYQNKKLSADHLDIFVPGKIRVRGQADYDQTAELGQFALDISDMPVQTWLPKQFKPHLDAFLRGHISWKGPVKQLANSEASGNLILDNAELRNPIHLKQAIGVYSLRSPDFIRFDRVRVDFSYKNETIYANTLQLYSNGKMDIEGSGLWSRDNQMQFFFTFDFNDLKEWLPEKLENRIKGGLSGHIQWTSSNGKIPEGIGGGDVRLYNGSLRHLKIQQMLCRFLKDENYLSVPLQTATVEWQQNKPNFSFQKINIFSPNLGGIRGDLKVSDKEELSGTLKIGLPEKSLTWLPEAHTTVFSEKKDGLYWATVKVSGTVKHPKHNLAAQIFRVLSRHPLKFAELAGRGLSWWLGDVFGTYESPMEKI